MQHLALTVTWWDSAPSDPDGAGAGAGREAGGGNADEMAGATTAPEESCLHAPLHGTAWTDAPARTMKIMSDWGNISIGQ